MTTNTETIEQTLADLLAAQLAGEAGTDARIDRDTDLTRDLGLESIQIMAFVTDVEDHYDVSIALESLSKTRTIADLAGIVAAELGQGG